MIRVRLPALVPQQARPALLFLAALAAVTTAAAAADYSFEWANPKPQGNPLGGLAFEDASTGYVVGDLGTCLKTSDGAVSWIDQTDFPAFDTKLNDAIVIGPGEILAVGAAPGIFRSTDGGASWSPIDNPSTKTLNNIEEIESGVLNIVGELGEVLRSTDNGATWSLLPSAGGGHLLDQFWWNASDGFVVGTVLARRTTDGGQTWNDLPGVTDSGVPILTDIHFIDPMNGWILEHFTTFRTTDGGTSWFEKHNFSGPSYQIEGHYVSTSERVVVTGLEGAFIWRTTDDGLNWTTLYERQTTQGYTDILELDDGTLVVCSTDGDLLRSDDGGDTWTNFTRSPEAAERNVLEAISIHPDGLAFAGGRGQLWLRSTDGGMTWEIPSSSPGIETTHDIVLRDGGLGLAGGYELGQSMVHRTTDGGVTWTGHEITGDYAGYPQDFAFPSDDVAYVVTSGGNEQNRAFRSTDGGVTWEDRTDGVGGNQPLLSVFFLDADTGFTSGGDFNNDAKIWKTTDGGSVWTPLGETGLQQAAIFDMHWFSESTGVVVGYEGVFRTTDGGQTWAEVLDEPVFFIEFRDALHGVAAAYFYSNVWTTSDGGVTWETVGLPWVGAPYAVASVPDGFYAAGGGSVILRGEESGSSSVDGDPAWVARSLRVFPNPTRGAIRVGFDNPAAAPVLLRVLDVHGREAHRVRRVLEPGPATISLARKLPPGVYFLEMSGPVSRRGRFVVLDGAGR